MFLQVSVILLTGGCLPQCMLGYTPWEQTPTPRADTPTRADTPRNRQPPNRHPPGADTPQSRHSLEQTPPEQTPPGADTPPEQTPPLHSMLGDTVNMWAVRILLQCNLVPYLNRANEMAMSSFGES